MKQKYLALTGILLLTLFPCHCEGGDLRVNLTTSTKTPPEAISHSYFNVRLYKPQLLAALPISARDMTESERRYYERQTAR